jgi:serine-type D-Ala-D-Ala carboxypeptidase/endopeptidase (penicillin-binding protein 4)
MRRSSLIAAALAVLIAFGGAVFPASSSTPTLRSWILAALRGSTADHAAFAVEVEGTGPGASSGGTTSWRPASTHKIYTALAALLRLGPDHRLYTEVRRTGDLRADGVLTGDLVLVGSGDPLLTSTQLSTLARNVARSGITRVTGGLYGDDSRFDRLSTAPGWEPRFVPHQTGPLTALTVDRNLWWDHQTYFRNPPLWNTRRFRSFLERAGVRVDGGERVGAAPNGPGFVITRRASARVADLVRIMLTNSDNFVAEQLLKEIGHAGGDGSTDGGLSVIDGLAADFGLASLRAYDGSGLSLYNRGTPWHEVAWLGAAERSPVGATFVGSMPVACGRTGSLRKRMCGTPAAGVVSAKTGNLADAVTLAGYARTRSGREARFSFMLSGVGSRSSARDAIDRAVVRIVQYAA